MTEEGKRTRSQARFQWLQEKLASCDTDECINWPFARAEKGYGVVSVDGTLRRVSRVTWELLFGPIPPGSFALHRCDNPQCFNPRHLFLGTHMDNMIDQGQKGRTLRGSQSGLSKLSEDQVREIRSLYVKGSVGYRTLSRQFGVEETAIRKIVNNKTWVHLLA